MAIRATVALYSNRTDIGEQHDGALPDVLVESGGGEFGTDDGIGGAQKVEAFFRDLADDSNSEAGAGEWLAANDEFRKSEFATDGAHLILE